MRILLFYFILLLNGLAQENSLPSLNKSQDGKDSFPFEMAKPPLASIDLFQYVGVILILVGLLIFLWYVKNRVSTHKSYSLLEFFKNKENINDINVTSTMSLGFQTKLIIFEAYGIRYLVLLSPNGVSMVDKYNIKKFEGLLQEEQEKLYCKK
ncbi:hypothetical protein LS72_000610 [Helicobacter apodemus]|uniref:Uncharacterized protein n=1 Tax=Helicobacter apodemus TaxID=135569 RepID=A0A4U8UHL9_9HELI|nr:hypothetical protein [Helicobacter apodemus]TLE17281.1 hypothetical protein LS72_000610 [Helicobacter apodemus]